MESERNASPDIFCELSSVRGFVDGNSGLWSLAESGHDAGRWLTATATETTIMAPEIAAGELGILSLDRILIFQSGRKNRKRGKDKNCGSQAATKRRRRQESATRSARVSCTKGGQFRGSVADLLQQQLA
jgi:hypothetical protein